MPLRGHLAHQGRRVLLKYHRLLDGVHRHPPNSVAALRHLVTAGAEVIEFDVALTRDRAFVLLHDATLERETTGLGRLRDVTLDGVKALRLRGSDEPPATLAEVVAALQSVRRPIKVQIDLKEQEPLAPDAAGALLDAVATLRANGHLKVVVGCLADWNLRALRKRDPALAVGLDFLHYLDAPDEEWLRLPLRVNAYGYLDDHPMGFRRAMPTAAYLEDRASTLLNLVDGASEVYLHKNFVLRALEDGFNPVEYVHTAKPGTLVDVWTFYADEPGIGRALRTVLDAGADQITSPACAPLAERFERDLLMS
jgi:glycerophosphoryl diester phosphodiesterase